jgi:hypothetical protein
LAANVANAGSKHLTIDRFGLLIQRRGDAEGYLLEPSFYIALGLDGNLHYDSLPVPVTVFGGENSTKQVMFGSSLERPTEFQLTKADAYDLTLLAWLHGEIRPSVADSFSIVVSEANATTLANSIKEKKPGSVKIPQSKWRSWGAHHLTENDVKELRRHY